MSAIGRNGLSAANRLYATCPGSRRRLSAAAPAISASGWAVGRRSRASAIHLYEKLGFDHDAEIMRIYGSRYGRCNVAMAYRGAA